jgi:CHAT domain-containing protein/Flp pilus assembly protein TadD
MFIKNNQEEKGIIQILFVTFLLICSFLTFYFIDFYIFFSFSASAEIVRNPYMEADGLAKEGRQLLEQKQFQIALKVLEKALTLYQQANNWQGEADILYSIGDIYYFQEKFAKAIDFYEKSLTINRKLGIYRNEAITLNDIGASYMKLDLYSKAFDSYQQALNIYKKKVVDPSEEATTLNNIGAVYNSQGEHQKALSYYQQGLDIRKKLQDLTGEGESLHNIGELYDNLGQYAQALEFYQQALTIAQKQGDHRGEVITMNGIGGIYSNLGQYQKALNSYQQALAIAKEVGDHRGEASSINGIGGVYDSLQQYPKALNSYQQALAVAKELGYGRGEASYLINIGGVYDSLQQYPKALNSYQQALAIAKELGLPRLKGYNLNNIGGVYDSLQQYPKALLYYHQALELFKEVGDQIGEAATLNNIGGTYYGLGQYAKAEGNFFAAIKIRESLRPGLTDENKISIFETQAHTYRMLQATLVFLHKIKESLEVAEMGRARAFVELLASRLSADIDKQDILSLQQTVAGLTFKQIKQIAQTQNATLVQYSILGNKDPEDLYIWVVQPTGKIQFRSIDLKKSLNTSLANLVTNSRESIGVRGRSSSIVIEALSGVDQTDRLKQLHKLLIEPIADLLPTDPNAHVIFMPQRELFLVPFPALQDKDGKYLIEKHTILTAPAIQVLDLTQKQRAKVKQANAKGLVIVGNPTMPTVIEKIGYPPQQLPSLPAAETEAIAIAKLLNTKALTGEYATKKTVLSELPQAKIIHLATHGLLDDFQSLGVPGAIALAPSGNDNGLLTASEILDLKLNAELVVLSACDTGRGRITGDGVIGLSRSLITAGVPSVIVSLWSVPDAPTAELMTEFYQNWQEKKLDKAQALRQAMLTTMKNRSNPKDWAAFTLIGEAN